MTARETVGAETARKPKKQPRPETILRREAMKWLRQQGWFVYHNMGGMGSFDGLADLTAIRNGVIVWVELKAPKGRQSEMQAWFQGQVEAHHGRYLLAKSIGDLKTLEVGE